jgi:uncharacterized protein with PQ loop repeat
MDIQTIQTIAGFTSSIMFVFGQIPMLIKVFKTRNLESYSLSNLLFANLGNLIHWVYLITIPGPLWYLHAFFTITTAIMLLLYLRYKTRAEKFGEEKHPFKIRKVEGGRENGRFSSRSPAPIFALIRSSLPKSRKVIMQELMNENIAT